MLGWQTLPNFDGLLSLTILMGHSATEFGPLTKRCSSCCHLPLTLCESVSTCVVSSDFHFLPCCHTLIVVLTLASHFVGATIVVFAELYFREVIFNLPLSPWRVMSGCQSQQPVRQPVEKCGTFSSALAGSQSDPLEK